MSYPEATTEPATETTPLISREDDDTLPNPIEPSNGIAPGGTLANGAPAKQNEDQEAQKADAIEYKGNAEMRAKMGYIFPALAIGVFLSAADQTIIVSSYGKIGSELKALNLTSWIATAYFLTLTSFQPLYGKLSDIFGRKPALLFAYAIFGIGSLSCGLARNMPELVAARVFQGIGGGGMTVVVSILLSDIIPLRERGNWQGYINIIYASGAGLGAPLGGFFVDSVGWRWAFLSQAPMTLIAFTAVSFALKDPVRDNVNWRQKLRRVDFLGAGVLIVAVFSLLAALDQGSNVSWSSPITIAAICVSLPAFLLFVFVEMKISVEPMAPGHIVFAGPLLACYLCNFFSFGGWLAMIFYIPLYYQVVDGKSATAAGLRLLPAIMLGVIGSLFAGQVMKRTGRYFWLTVICYATLVLGMIPVILCTGSIVKSTIGISIGISICGFSNGIGVTSSLIALIANATPADQAIATACSYLFRSLGSVTGVSLSSTIFQQSLRNNLAHDLKNGQDAERIVKGVRQSIEFIWSLKPELRELVVDCYEHAIFWSFIFSVVVSAGAFFSAWGIREKKLGG